MDTLIGEKGLYPSRSELIRVAVKEFLVKELEAAQSFTQMQKHNSIAVTNRPPEIDTDLYVRVPIDPNSDNIEDVQYKTYRIIRK